MVLADASRSSKGTTENRQKDDSYSTPCFFLMLLLEYEKILFPGFREMLFDQTVRSHCSALRIKDVLRYMENVPNTENIAYLDEYPHLTERCRLRRLGRPALGPALILVMPLPLRDDPDFRSLMETPPQDFPDDSA